MGHGHLRYRPGWVMGVVPGLPNVRTSATSDWRTWKVKSSSRKMTTSTAPTITFNKFLFFMSKSFRVHVQKVRANFVFEVEDQNVLRVRNQQNIFARIFGRVREHRVISALFINQGSSFVRRDLIGEQV